MRTVDAGGLQIGDEHPPRVMGVLNVSEESPYDPSVFADPGEAAAYVDDELIEEGADVVDVGLESANKRYEVLSAEEELERLDVAVEAIESTSGDAVFSIETRYAEVAEAAVERGFDLVNDVCGFADPEMPTVCEEYDVAVVKMASPPDLQRPGAIDDIDWTERRSAEWLERSDYVDRVYEALRQNGLTEKTLVDPAFGGWSERKTLEHDRETFRRLFEFRALGCPILVSINRKNFLRSVAGRPTEAALPASLAATSMAVERGAHVIRTHDVAETRDAALIGAEFAADRGRAAADDVSVEQLDVPTRRSALRHVEAAGGEPDAAGAAVGGAFRVEGLDDERRASLATAAEEAGAVCTGGRPSAERPTAGDQHVASSAARQTIVAGSATALAELASKLTGRDGLEPLRTAIRSSPDLRENL